MDKPDEVIQKGKYLIEIHQDPDPINPRTDCDNMTVMACFHSRYNLGDVGRKDFQWSNSREGMQEFSEWLEENRDKLVYKELRLYDHSGLTISASGSYPYNDRWDSSSVGVIYVEKERILKEFGIAEWGPEAEEKANGVLDGDIETYDNYLRGECYGYQIKNSETGEDLDSCWGYLGDKKYCIEEAESMVEHYLQKDKEWEDQATDSVRYIKVKVVVKHSPDINPEDVLNECDYSFTSNTDGSVITDTELQGYSEE